MKKVSLLIMVALFSLILCETGLADSGSLGIKLAPVQWREKDLFGSTQKASGMMYGPSVMFRFGDKERWSIGLEGLYGEFEDLSRADIDAMVMYNISPLFGVFVNFKYSWYEFDGTDDPTIGAEVETSGFGGGVGINFEAPLGRSPFFVFANTRIVPMKMKTDVADSDGWALLWSMEGGLAAAFDLGLEHYDISFYSALGYRYRIMRNSDFDESVSIPFVEAGFKQEF